MSATETTSTLALATSIFESVAEPPLVDVTVSSTSKEFDTSFSFNKFLSLSKLTTVPVAPEVPPVTVSFSTKLPVVDVKIKLFLNAIVGGVGDASYPSPNSFVFSPITLPISVPYANTFAPVPDDVTVTVGKVK